MGNPDKGEVTLTIGEKAYTMTLKTAGLAALQKRLSPAGKVTPLDKVLLEVNDAINQQSLEHIVIFLWASFRKYHPEITESRVMDLIDEAGGVVGLETKLSEIAQSVQPDKEDLEELTRGANPQKAQAKKMRGAGARSVSALAP